MWTAAVDMGACDMGMGYGNGTESMAYRPVVVRESRSRTQATRHPFELHVGGEKESLKKRF